MSDNQPHYDPEVPGAYYVIEKRKGKEVKIWTPENYVMNTCCTLVSCPAMQDRQTLRAELSQAQQRVEELENMLVRWHNTAGDRLMPGEYEDWLDVDYVRQWGQAYYRYMKAQEQLENEAERLSEARAAEREEAEGG